MQDARSNMSLPREGRAQPQPAPPIRPAARTREIARARWDASGLTLEEVGRPGLRRLRNLVDAEMVRSGALRGTFRAAASFRLWRPWGQGLAADLRCAAFYFHDRQAITFEADGFVGFAGWADDRNVRPILDAFAAWMDERDPLTTSAAERALIASAFGLRDPEGKARRWAPRNFATARGEAVDAWRALAARGLAVELPRPFAGNALPRRFAVTRAGAAAARVASRAPLRLFT